MNGFKTDLMPLGVAAIGIAAVFLGADILKKWAPGGAGNPVAADVVYENPALCVLFGKYCHEEASAGSTGPVPSPYPVAWTEDPTTYWAKARASGDTLQQACAARAPTAMQYDICMQTGWG
jgi:hypothetical protein